MPLSLGIDSSMIIGLSKFLTRLAVAESHEHYCYLDHVYSIMQNLFVHYVIIYFIFLCVR